MKTIQTLFIATLLVGMAYGQGTLLNGPVAINPPAGGSPTFILDLIPASPSYPCIAAPTGYYALCGQNKEITVDFGDGNGFVSLRGKDGINGTNGTNGTNGAPGPAWSPAGHTFSIHCAQGGHGVPNFSVSGCTITQTN